MFQLFYYCQNNGDGSASVRFCPTEQKAKEGDESQSEPFAEPSVSSVQLKVKGNKLYYGKMNWMKGKMEWHEIKPTETN